jgi:hypothetical protein
MATMGAYCKAYQLRKLREYGEWTENAGNARKVKNEVNGEDVEVARTLTDDDYLYLQENFLVTDGIFLDEYVIFDGDSPAWRDYCIDTLKFEVPVYESAHEV